jgi:hypothetical protein
MGKARAIRPMVTGDGGRACPSGPRRRLQDGQARPPSQVTIGHIAGGMMGIAVALPILRAKGWGHRGGRKLGIAGAVGAAVRPHGTGRYLIPIADG